MGRVSAKMMFLVLAPIMLRHLVISSSSSEEVKPNENGICISKGGERFSPHESNACFSINATNQVLVPCGGSNEDSKWKSNGTVSTSLFTLQTESSEKPEIETESSEKPVTEKTESEKPVTEKTESNEKSVTETESSEKPVIETESSPVIETESSEKPVIETESSEKTENFAWFRDLEQKIREMTLVQRMTWVVAAIVGGRMIFNRWRNHQERLDMVQRNARRLGMPKPRRL